MRSILPSILTIAAALSVVGLRVDHACAAEQILYVQLSGAPNPIAPGLVPHGDPSAKGVATLVFHPDTLTMDFAIQLDSPYVVTQAHMYHLGIKPNGDSVFCWGGRWSDHDFLMDEGFQLSAAHFNSVMANPSEWYLMIHTEGGHFANEGAGLIVYDPDLHETSVTGQTESGTRFNNRVGMRLDDRRLRLDNPYYTQDNAAFPAGHFDRLNDTPYVDALGNQWLEPDGQGGFQLTQAALAAGYDLETEYLFYRYSDDGPQWDYGGPEGALGGFLQINPVPEPCTLALLAVATVLVTRRRPRFARWGAQ